MVFLFGGFVNTPLSLSNTSDSCNKKLFVQAMYSETASAINGICPSAAPCLLMSRDGPVVVIGIGILLSPCEIR